MAIPWLRILDTVVGLSNLTGFARGGRSNAASADLEESPAGSRTLGHLETRLAGVVVAALKEAFDRDTRRLELEREQMERERARADRLLKLELLRQAGDREIGRLRMTAGVAVAGWIGTLLLVTRLVDGPIGARVMVGAGWLLLLAAIALSFAAQAHVSRALARIDELTSRQADFLTGGPGTFAPWLVVLGLAAIGIAVLLG